MDENEEFEFRARAEAEAEKQKQAEAAAQPPSAGHEIVNNVVAPAFGIGKAALDLGGAALSNPLVQHGLELAGGGIAARKFLVNPVLNALQPAGQAMGQHINNVTDAMNRQAAASEAYSQGVAQRAAARAGGMPGPVAPGPVPNISTGAPTGAPTMTVPQTPPAPPPVGGQAAAEGSNFLENMANKFGSLAQRVAPVLNNPVVRGVAKIGGVGGQMATYSPGLNTGEAAELERRRKVPFQPYSR